MRSILPKGESRKRRSIAVRAIACVLVALLALPFAGCSASPNATGGTAGSQEYTVSVSLSGGSGRASIASPTTIVKDGDTYTATITWSSSNYDKMTVNGVDYAPVNDGDNSTFEIPVTLDEDIADVPPEFMKGKICLKEGFLRHFLAEVMITADFIEERVHARIIFFIKLFKIVHAPLSFLFFLHYKPQI